MRPRRPAKDIQLDKRDQYRSEDLEPDALIDDEDELLDAPAGQLPPDRSFEGLAAETGSSEPVVFTVSAIEHGQRLDRALCAWVPQYSRSHLQSLVEADRVHVDGQAVRLASRRLKLGSEVAVDLQPPASEQAFVAEPMPIDIRHEDEHLWVLHKPPGLVVHPAAGHWQGTLLNGLLALDARMHALPRAGIVHRLDKDTSGLMVVARTLEAMSGLVRAIAAREVHREYQALVHGEVSPGLAQIDAPIARDPAAKVRMAVRAAGKPARTDIQRMGVRMDGRAGTVTALQCRLHTGRTHQIRVHLAHKGHPLIGDTLYGGRALLGMHRQALHAARLAFVHPVTGVAVDVAAAPPADFDSAWRQVLSLNAGDGH